jgi:NAD-dependent deacetylase
VSDNVNIDPQLADCLRRAKSVAVLTGAGVSAESGVPTFRDALTGLWARFDPEELATPEAFLRNPALVWEWYASRRAALAGAQPNPGHVALAEIERRVGNFTLATQNVDGLHAKAGSRNVVELHGNILRTRCFDADHLVEDWEEDDRIPPHCPYCGSLLRPDVVWFGEMLPSGAIERADEAARACDVFLCVGTSALVFPAAALPESARRSGAVVVEINPRPSAVADYADFTLAAPSGIALPALARAAFG